MNKSTLEREMWHQICVCFNGTHNVSYQTNQTNCNLTCDKHNPQNIAIDLSSYFTREMLIIFHTLYVVILVFGILGNLLTIYVIIHRKSMRRAIHLYTCNLAVTDLFILVFYVPTQMSMLQNQLQWTMGLVMCKVNYVILPIALTSSIATLLAITVDRFRGLVTPFSWRSDSQRHAKIIIPVTWLVSLFISIPLFIYAQVDVFVFTSSYSAVYCFENWPSNSYSDWYWITNFVLVFAVPLIVIVMTQVFMLFTISNELDTVNRNQSKHMIRLVVALVLIFTVCTGFQHVYYFIGRFGNLSLSNSVTGALFGSSNLVVSLQAALNPIIYGTLRHDFKKAFRNILVMILIKLRLYKKALSDDGSKNFTTRVLSNYFSESKHQQSPNRHYRHVGQLFQKRIEADRLEDDSFFYGTPSSSMLRLASTDGSESDYVDSPLISKKENNCFGSPGLQRRENDNLHFPHKQLFLDSPRVSKCEEYLHSSHAIMDEKNNVKLIGYRKCARQPGVTSILHKNIRQKYSDSLSLDCMESPPPPCKPDTYFSSKIKSKFIPEIIITSPTTEKTTGDDSQDKQRQDECKIERYERNPALLNEKRAVLDRDFVFPMVLDGLLDSKETDI